MCTVDGEVGELSVQGPVSMSRDTVRPELDVASIPKSASPNVRSVIAPKLTS